MPQRNRRTPSARPREEVALSGALRDELLYGLAHDLSTLQAALQLHTRLLAVSLDRLGGAVKGDLPGLTGVQASASQVARASALVGEFARDFIEVCRGHPLEGFTAGPPGKGFLLSEIFELARMVFQPRAEQKGLSLRIAPAPACLLQGDGKRLQRVLFNLIDNALKYTPRGQIQVEASWSQGDGLQLVVSDTGVGLSATTRARPPGVPGFGLGLKVVKRVVQDMGGTLEVASDASGTRVSVRLPLRGALLHAAEGSSRLLGARVLLMSDDVWMARHDASLLRSRGASVMAASQTKRHLQLLSAWRPHALIAHLSEPRPLAGTVEVLRKAATLTPMPLYLIASPTWMKALGEVPLRRPPTNGREASWGIEELIEAFAADFSALERERLAGLHRHRRRASARARPSLPHAGAP